MINEANLVNDSPNNRGMNDNTESIWSYNQGVILSGLSDLTGLTGDGAYLERGGENSRYLYQGPCSCGAAIS